VRVCEFGQRKTQHTDIKTDTTHTSWIVVPRVGERDERLGERDLRNQNTTLTMWIVNELDEHTHTHTHTHQHTHTHTHTLPSVSVSDACPFDYYGVTVIVNGKNVCGSDCYHCSCFSCRCHCCVTVVVSVSVMAIVTMSVTCFSYCWCCCCCCCWCRCWCPRCRWGRYGYNDIRVRVRM